MATKQTWRVELDEANQEIRYFTRSDDKLRQTFKVADLPTEIRNRLAIRGVKVTMEERNSSVPAAAIQASMDARDDVWDLWKSGTWAKQRTGGGFTVRIEIQALAAIYETTTSAIRESLKGYSEEEIRKIFTSDKVKAKIAELRDAETEETVDLSDML